MLTNFGCIFQEVESSICNDPGLCALLSSAAPSTMAGSHSQQVVRSTVQVAFKRLLFLYYVTRVFTFVSSLFPLSELLRARACSAHCLQAWRVRRLHPEDVLPLNC